MTITAKEKEQRVIAGLVGWGEARESVRAMILTSTRTNPNSKPDAFSDYDVIVAVRDIQPYLEDDSWLGDFGRVLVVYRDPIRLWHGSEKFARITQYEDGLKIDFTICPLEILSRIKPGSELEPDFDIGYSVLLDKDGLTQGWKRPTYRAYIPTPPSEAEYLRVVEEFFHEATYLAKSLWRGELMPAKYFLDQAMKQNNLLKVLEWRMEIDQDWSVKTGVFGKGLKKGLPPELWAELESTYVGAGEDENWEAMFRTIELFRKVAVKVGESLSYSYPYELDQKAVAYLRKVKDLDRDAEVVEF